MASGPGRGSRASSRSPASTATTAAGAVHTPVVIVGAGLTGMAAAYHLRQLGVSCRIIERQAQVGGHATTIEDEGYRFDRTGHLLHLNDDTTRQLALSWIGPAHREIERRSVIWSSGAYTRYPFQANLKGLPPKVAYECLLGFLQARQRQSEAGAAVRNFEEYCLATFGKGISEHFMIPYNSRLWGVPPREISADWCSRFVPVPQLEDVIAGAVGHPSPELGYNVSFIYPTDGIGALSQGLAAAVGDIELERSPRALSTTMKELVVDDETIRYDVLINTAPLPRLIGLCDDAPAEVKRAAAQLRCTHLYYLDVALGRPCGQPHHWVYVPEAKYPFYRVGCYSHFSPAMAPAGKANLYVELVDRDEPVLAELLPQVTAGLIEMGIIDEPRDVAFARLRRIDYAYVIFDHRYYRSLEVIEAFLGERRILSCGRYGAWNYSAMGDALRYGRQAAEQAARWLHRSSERGRP